MQVSQSFKRLLQDCCNHDLASDAGAWARSHLTHDVQHRSWVYKRHHYPQILWVHKWNVDWHDVLVLWHGHNRYFFADQLNGAVGESFKIQNFDGYRTSLTVPTQASCLPNQTERATADYLVEAVCTWWWGPLWNTFYHLNTKNLIVVKLGFWGFGVCQTRPKEPLPITWSRLYALDDEGHFETLSTI